MNMNSVTPFETNCLFYLPYLSTFKYIYTLEYKYLYLPSSLLLVSTFFVNYSKENNFQLESNMSDKLIILYLIHFTSTYALYIYTSIYHPANLGFFWR